MGNIPEFRRSSLQQTAQPSLVQSAGAEYRALAGVADTAMQLAFEQKKANDMAFASTKSVEFDIQSKQAIFDWQQKYSGDPLNKEAQTQLKQTLAQQADQFASQAPSAAAAGYFKRLSDARTGDLLGHSVSWANEQNVKNLDQTYRQSNDTIATDVLKSGREEAILEGLKQHNNNRTAAAPDMGEAWAKTYDIDGKRNIVAAGIDGAIEQGRFGDAQRMLKKKEFTDLLGSDETKRLMSRMQKKEQTVRELSENTLVKKTTDPWEYSMDVQSAPGKKIVNTTQLPGFTPIDYSPEGMSRSFEQRQRFIDHDNQRLGIDLPMLTPSEEADLIKRLETGSPEDQAGFMSMIRGNTTKAQSIKIGQQVFAKEPALAAAMGLAPESPKISEKIIRGHQLMKFKGIEAPENADIDAEFESYVRDTIPVEEHRGLIKSALKALVVQNMIASGKKSPKDLGSSDIKDALKEMIGPSLEINGATTLSFKNQKNKWVDEDEFEDILDAVEDSDFPKFGNGIPNSSRGPLTAEQVRDSYRFKLVSDGIYAFEDENGGIAVNEKGKPYQFSLKEMERKKTVKKSFFRNIKENLGFGN